MRCPVLASREKPVDGFECAGSVAPWPLEHEWQVAIPDSKPALFPRVIVGAKRCYSAEAIASRPRQRRTVVIGAIEKRIGRRRGRLPRPED